MEEGSQPSFSSSKPQGFLGIAISTFWGDRILSCFGDRNFIFFYRNLIYILGDRKLMFFWDRNLKVFLRSQSQGLFWDLNPKVFSDRNLKVFLSIFQGFQSIATSVFLYNFKLALLLSAHIFFLF